MLLSHSPPVYGHSPPTSSFLADYPAFLSPEKYSTIPHTHTTCRAASPSSFCFASRKTMPASPIRPCLVIRTDEPLSSDEDPTSPTKLKKKVVFADDRGMSLTQVRVMTEPSNIPPLFSPRFLSVVTHGLSVDSGSEMNVEEPWEIPFPQPASDYIAFREKLEKEKVSLENVIVKEKDQIIMGTVKVSNLAYDKEVFARVTADNWASQEDVYCNFAPNSMHNNCSSVSGAYVLYDTFSFKIAIPPKARRVEFCLCFRCDNREFWDSNKGKNYVLMKKTRAVPITQKDTTSRRIFQMDGKNILKTQYDDAVNTKLDSWSEFASWTHLENSHPYW